MNQRTARLIRRFASIKNAPYRPLKRRWSHAPRPVRHLWREHMEKTIQEHA